MTLPFNNPPVILKILTAVFLIYILKLQFFCIIFIQIKDLKTEYF